MMISWTCPWCGTLQEAHIEHPRRTGAQPMVLLHCDIEEGGCDTASAVSVKIEARADVHVIELQPHKAGPLMPRGDFPDNWSSSNEDPV